MSGVHLHSVQPGTNHVRRRLGEAAGHRGNLVLRDGVDGSARLAARDGRRSPCRTHAHPGIHLPASMEQLDKGRHTSRVDRIRHQGESCDRLGLPRMDLALPGNSRRMHGDGLVDHEADPPSCTATVVIGQPLGANDVGVVSAVGGHEYPVWHLHRTHQNPVAQPCLRPAGLRQPRPVVSRSVRPSHR